MTSLVSTNQDRDLAARLRRATVRAVLAPSVHNSQPWRLVLEADALTVLPDRSRRVPVFDPLGRQLLLSCGCAAANAQISLAADGRAARVVVGGGAWPEVRVEVRPGRPHAALAVLDAVVDRRATPRSPLRTQSLPRPLVERLCLAAARTGAQFGVVETPQARAAVERMAGLAGRVLASYPEYLAELRAWTSSPARSDGLGAAALDVLSREARADERDETWTDHGCDLVWIATPHDDPRAWAEAGVLLERVLLELTRAGLAAVPLAQVVEVPTQRQALAAAVGTPYWPQMVLRVGSAPSGTTSRRRRLVDVIA